MSKTYLIYKTDHGTDGWDARSTSFAKTDSWEDAYDYIQSLGHCVEHRGEMIPRTVACIGRMLYHQQPEKRYTMGCITYDIREDKTPSVKELKNKKTLASVKPCPFCGQAPTTRGIMGDANTYVFCQTNAKPCTTLQHIWTTVEDWNKRA